MKRKIQSGLPSNELDDFSQIIVNAIESVCEFADKHNYDRDSALEYLVLLLHQTNQISTIENYEVK